MSKRRCAFLDCDSVEGVQHLYSFPAHDPNICQIWVRRSSNTELAGLPLEALTRKYACEKHFTPNSFKSSARRYLWPNAKPIYGTDGQLLEDVDDSAELQLLVPGSKGEDQIWAYEKEQIAVCENQLKLKDSSEEQEHLLPRLAPSVQASLNLKQANTGYSQKRMCSFAGCDSVEGEKHLFSFPTHEPNICLEWARRTGDPALLGLPPEYLKRKYVCENHFSPNSFVSSARTRLHPNVRPVYTADGQLIEGVDETEAQQQCPKQKRRLKELIALQAKPRKAQNKLRMAAKTPEPESLKSSEDTETGTSPECVPIPAGAMLGKMYSGNMSDVCSLCLCEDGKLLPNTNVYLKDDYTEGNFSLTTLVREMQLDKIISRNAVDSFCELCVQQLSLFYLFKRKCTRLGSGLNILYTFSQNTRDDATVVLPYETIQEYAIQDENSKSVIPTEDFTQEEWLDSGDKMNVDTFSKPDSLINEPYFDADQSDLVKYTSNTNSKTEWQSELNRYSTVTKCIVQGTYYCSCCLTEHQELFEVLETMLFMEGQNEFMPLKNILFEILFNKSNEPVFICQDCLDIAIKAYNFKTMFHKSTTIIRNCVSCFETCLTNFDNTVLSDDVRSIHLNFYELFNKFISPVHAKNVTSAKTKRINRKKVNQDKNGVNITVRSLHKNDELTSACHICGQAFYSSGDVEQHISTKHKDLLYCSYCNNYCKLNNKSQLIKHIAYCQTVDRPFVCDLCNMKFCRKSQVSAHRLRHFPKTLKCDYCQMMFWSQRDLNDHKLNAHRELLQLRYDCSVCHAVFSTRKDITAHKATHPADSMHTCKYCGASYRTKSGYYAHSCVGKLMNMRSRNRNRNMNNSNVENDVTTITYGSSASTICDICGLALKNSASLDIHRRSHLEGRKIARIHKVKKAMCDTCGMMLKDLSSVKRHRMVCSSYMDKQLARKCEGIKRKPMRKILYCDHCNYSSQLKMCLELHLNKHHFKRKPYGCSFCEKTFHTTAMLKTHEKLHIEGVKLLKCNVCGNFFKYKNCLKYHMRLHTGERPYPCDLCDESFISASRRQDHRTRQHFEPTVQCEICSKFCYFQRDLREHLRKRHKIGVKVKTEGNFEQ